MRLDLIALATLFAISGLLQAEPARAAKLAKPNPAAAKSRQTDDDIPPDVATNNLKGAPQAPTLGCTGPFAKDTTQAKLVTAFGAKNVAFKDVETAGNIMEKATVIFDGDPTKRMVFFWRDNKTQSKLTSILIEAPATWIGPGGLRNGLPLKELEKLNGGAFSMVAFGGTGSGNVTGLKGPFAAIEGGCTLTAKFEPGIANPLPPRYAAITGSQTLVSSNLLLRRARPQVTEWRVNY